MVDAAKSGQLVLQAAMEGSGTTKVNMTVMMASYAPPATYSTDSGGLYLMAGMVEMGLPRTTQGLMLVAYKTAAPENLASRAWTFTLDGHTFYVITLGNQGTFLYDMDTKQWAQWKTEGYTNWNMEQGTNWQGKIIAADTENPILWELDPTSFIDEGFRPQTRVVTGALAMRGRDYPQNYAFRVTASMGQVDSVTGSEDFPGTVQLRHSDDQGNTWVDDGVLTVEEDNYIQVLQWLSLGSMQPPKRIFEITDIGAVARLSGADAEVDGED
tara:strand:- start:12115 stop:12924 length:810 start_codon:yes stop_codon:yes gene_type:complete